jgi:hypothetical protein
VKNRFANQRALEHLQDSKPAPAHEIAPGRSVGFHYAFVFVSPPVFKHISGFKEGK